ncbi:MAG: [protein-PII] uridylyltransferase, partial [Candidatus Hydrogenedentes bacterium]|nr:[protein-PII] uridylyltransferase [Candidatus Hydrogenedentota bacterium]
PGADIIRALADVADTVVRGVLELCAAQVRERKPVLGRVALCALGGYGRGELSPCSDLDLCLLYTKRLDAGIEQLNQRLLPCLWDLGFRIGYSLHSVKEALALSRKDPQVYTTYAQARLLAGEKDIFAKLKHLLRSVRGKELEALLESVAQREHPDRLPERYRDLYHPEPDIKENVGGLRDYHAARWMVLLRHGIGSFDELERLGMISSDEHLEGLEGLDFLWRIRNELHFSTGKPDNLLTFALQRQVTEAFGYGLPSPSASERFMQDYYTAARRTRRLLLVAARVCEHQAETALPEMPLPGRDGFAVHQGRLRAGADDPNWFVENPVRLMEIFWECARRRISLSRGTERRVAQHLHLVNDTFRTSAMVRRFFLAICSRPFHAGAALRQAAGAGLLGAYLPEFQAIHGIVRYADFHSYPVDEHTLRAIEALAEVPRLEGAIGSVLERALEHVRDPYVLVLAILFHDLGKATGEEHVEEGVRLARQICGRIGLGAEESERVAFLVQHHMLMTNISIYRDTDDPDIVNAFAETMQTDDRLRELLLVSYADLSAVGPGVWNEWKGALLLKLFLKAERILQGRAKVEEEAEFWRHPKAMAVPEHLPEGLREKSEHHLQALGERYLLAFTPEDIARHIVCLEEARATGLALECRAREETSMSEVVICTRDRHGLFAEMAGSFASQLIDVHNAAIFTTRDGFVVDCFTVRDAANGRPLTGHQFEALKKVLRDVLLGGKPVQALVDQSRRRLFALMQPRVPTGTRISFDNTSSRTDTVIDIETGDRTGLLYDIARALAERGVDFRSARIVTDARRVRDSFYVRMNDAKLEGATVQERVREALLEAILPMTLAGTQGDTQ